MVNYPSQIDTSQSLPTVIDNKTPIQGSVFNRLRDAVLAIESELGINPSSLYATVKSRLDTIETTFNNFSIIELAKDLGGTLSYPLVIGLQGRPISSALPSMSQFLSWNGISWSPTSFISGGDITGTYPNFTVTSLQNKTVSVLDPQSGNVLQAIDSSSLGYGPVNLNGGINCIVGILPTTNQANQSLIGDVIGTTNNNVVGAIQHYPVNSIAPVTGQILEWGGTSWTPTNLGSGLILSGTIWNIGQHSDNNILVNTNNIQLSSSLNFPSTFSLNATSINVTGNSNFNSTTTFQTTTSFVGIPTFNSTVLFSKNITPTIKQDDLISDVPTHIINITAQAPFIGATGGNRRPGSISLNLSTPSGGGTVRGQVVVVDDGNTVIGLYGDMVGNGTVSISGTGILTAGTSLAITASQLGFYTSLPVSQASRATNAPLTAASGAASNTISDVGSSFNQATLNNNFKSIATTLNALELIIHQLGLSA